MDESSVEGRNRNKWAAKFTDHFSATSNVAQSQNSDKTW